MKSALVLLIFFALSSCATGGAASKLDRQPDSYRVVSLGPAFREFWSEAQGQPFEKQVEAWAHRIEAPQQRFYDELVWQKNTTPDWPARRLRNLTKRFPEYPSHYEEIQSAFDSFPELLSRKMDAFRSVFPDAHFTHTIEAVPSYFDGKTGDVSDESGRKHPTLAFAIDSLVIRHTNLDVLFTHELFHLYHFQKMGDSEDALEARGHLTLMLWFEGLATYVSAKLNPTAPAKDFLEKAARVPLKDLPWAAQRFLKDANEKAFDEKKPEIYRNWFYGSKELRPDLDLPLGYFLGYHVAEHLVHSHSLQEVVSWSPDKVHDEVTKALRELARR